MEGYLVGELHPLGLPAAIASPALAEIQDIWYWDPSVGHYNPSLTEAPTILIGNEAGAQFILYNLSGGYLDLGFYITAFDPLGNSLGATKTGLANLPPGGSLGGHYKVVTDRPGTYIFNAYIITSNIPPYGIIGSLENVPVAHAVGEIPPVAGHVYQPFVHDATTGETFYSTALPVGIEGGHEVIVGVRWMNDGGETATFTSTFGLIDPDGISREVQTFTTVLSPSGHTGGQTGMSVFLDKAGIWKIHAILEAEGSILDEETWNAITVATLPPTELETLEVTIDPYGAGYVTTSPAPESGTQHNWQFPYGITVNVTAHPNPGYIFESWSGEMTDTTAITAPVYPMTEHRLITAHFRAEIATETLEVKIDPAGSGYVTVSPEPAGGVEHNWQFLYGTTVNVTAHPNPGYIFESWSGEMTDTTAITAPVYPMTEHRLITAHFRVEIVTETLAVTIDPYGAGYVTTSPEPESGTQHNWQFLYGTIVYVTAHPNPGYIFDRWSGEMQDTTAITAPVYPMTEHRLITAHFKSEIATETLEVEIGPYGAGHVTTSPAPVGGVEHNWQFLYGTMVTVTAHPNPGYIFDRWSGEMQDTTAITAVVYPMTEHRLITAHFKLEVEEEYELIQHTIYPYAYVYDGVVDITTATFRIDPFTPSAWAAKKLADSVASEAAKNSSRVIDLKAYVDTSPILWTDIKIELTATPIGGVAAGVGAIGIPIWASVLIMALAVIGVIVAITLAIKTVAGLFKQKPLSEEIKLTWSRETLISAIGDFEVKLELAPTSPEDLETKSDQELRDYCDTLAEEIVPSEFPWALVVVGGVFVAAAIGLAAYGAAPRRKKK